MVTTYPSGHDRVIDMKIRRLLVKMIRKHLQQCFKLPSTATGSSLGSMPETTPTKFHKEIAISGSMIKILLAIAIFGMTTSSNAETLSFPSFRIEVEAGWVHSLERGPQAHHEVGELISIYHPNGNGILKMQSYSAPDFVSKEILRNMTNVEWSTPLIWQNWGDCSGYQYDYSERGSFYRQWWLANERTIIFIVYDSNTESKDIEIDEINKIVDSITVNKP